MSQKQSYEGVLVPEKFQLATKEKELMRNKISMFYDIQKLRISCGNRIVGSIYLQAGMKPSEDKSKMDKEVTKMIDKLKIEYKRLTDAMTDQGKTFKQIMKKNKSSDLDIQYIRTEGDFDMMDTYMNLLNDEETMEHSVALQLKGIPIYEKFLKNVKGCGTLMSACLIAYLDIYKAKYVSSFIKYCGIDTLYDEEADAIVGRKMKHTEMKEYIKKDGTTDLKRSITYNPFLKTKLVGVLAGCMIKAKSDYAVPFYEYKFRKQNDPRYKDYSPGHINKMAIRYMMKNFLKDLFVTWKTLEGLPVPKSYEEEYLGMAPHKWQPYDEFRENHPEIFVKKEEDE